MSQKKQISSTFKHTFIYSISTFLQKGVGFIMLPVFAHYLGSEGYGIFGMIEVVTSIMTVIVGYGLLGGMQRFYYEKKTDRDRNTVISTAIIVTIAIVAVVTLPTLFFSRFISAVAFGSESIHVYIVIAVCAFFFEMTAQSAGGYLLIKQNSALFTWFSIQRFVTSFVLNIYFLIYLEMGVLGLLYSSLISVIIYSSLLHWYALKRTGLSFSRSDAKDILKYNLPLIPGYVAGLIRNDFDKIALRAFLGLSQLGSYNMLQKFSSLIAMFVVQPFLRIWTVKRLEVCEDEDGPVLMARMFTLQLALMLFIALIIALEVPLILKVMTPSDFWLPGHFALLAVIAKVLFGAYYHFNFGLIYEKITYKISVIQASAALVGIGCNLVLVKFYGISGALISSNIVFLFQCLLAHFMSRKYYPIPFEWFKVAGLFISTIVLYFAIGSIDVASYFSGSSIDHILSVFAVQMLAVFNLDTFKDGQLVAMVSTGLPLMIEGLVKLLLSVSYLVVLVVCGLISTKQLASGMKMFAGKLHLSAR